MIAFVEPTTATGIVAYLTIFVLAAFVGIEVISKVPSILHTPLMSGSNAIHGIVLVGALTIMGEAHGAAELSLGFLAVFLATLNVVGGFVVTDRMLEMFKSRPGERGRGQAAADAGPAPNQGGTVAGGDGGAGGGANGGGGSGDSGDSGDSGGSEGGGGAA